MTQIITGHDAAVAAWMFETSGSRPIQFVMAIGLADKSGQLAGGAMFTNWNGSDAEVHFYGPGYLTKDAVRMIMGLAALQLNVNRLTIHTRKPHMSRGVKKLGAKFECIVHRLYGPSDEPHDAGERWVFFRETIEKLAGLTRLNGDLANAA